ncbi:hypothetical protein GSI_14177 [Ganoderma sinense ZZ0214-1]|uniref:Uncharacterized protein n=1 Tax=Ganoderma sinense ZZ0214-1 TaxID=1077348 RepID=A0A2G8RSF3_9APHY|nr:hypothetical protein GSI_14177 [Ganoderma sinense ZZ0214-1]
MDDVYSGSRVVTEVSLEFRSEAPYLSTSPRLTAQIRWKVLRSLDITVQCPGSRVPSSFHLTEYNFPALTTLRLVNVPLHRDSQLSVLRSLTLKNAARRHELRTDFRRFMQPLCTSYRQLERLTLDHALTDAPNVAKILSTEKPLRLTALSIHDAPGRVSGVLDYLDLASCTELHLATTIRGVRPTDNTPNPFLHLLSANWVCWAPPQLTEMNRVFVEVTTGRHVRMQLAYDPTGPYVPNMESTGALRAAFDVCFEKDPSATVADVMLLQGRTLVGAAETIPLLKMDAVTRIQGMTEKQTQLMGELDYRPDGRLRWFSKVPGQREWKELTL